MRRGNGILSARLPLVSIGVPGFDGVGFDTIFQNCFWLHSNEGKFDNSR